MLASLLLFAAATLPSLTIATTGRAGHGLIGYGISMYHPDCAHACHGVLSESNLNCSTMMFMDGEYMLMADAECYATDDAFLTSVAVCMDQRCTDLEIWEKEKYWEYDLPGTDADQPKPKWSYQETLERVASPPNVTIVYGDPLNKTSLVSDSDYNMQLGTLATFETMEDEHETYGLVLLVTGAAIPVAFSLLRFVPFPKVMASKFNAIFIDPPLLGPRHKIPYFNLAVMPTRGQAFFIAYLIIINVVLSALGYKSSQPNGWYSNRNVEILTYFTNRVGVLSFANIPLLVLYAGRNNILYWVTNWSQCTFILLHRWVAYIATLQAILHSLVYLRIYIVQGTDISESQLAYWYWGSIATIGMSILLPLSIIPIRQKMYELFLASHFVISLLALVGCYLHIYYRFEHQWGYEVWIYVAFAVWGFDRLMRVLRLARNGLRKAVITVIDDDHVRVDVEGLTGSGHAYLYFPTLTWRVWENHPFSITASSQEPLSSDTASTTTGSDIEAGKALDDKNATVTTSRATTPTDPPLGLTFLVRPRNGVTTLLRNHRELPVLVESDYLPPHDCSKYQTLVCIAGGVGITAIVPILRMYPGRARLYWSSRSAQLVDSVQPMLSGLKVDKQILVGERHDVSSILTEEAQRGTGDMGVVVSGPASMSDDVRMLVSKVSRSSRRPIELIEESFIW